ncbi:MAG TPA: hypothetical protein VKX28_26840 [Xanthobacteraceae bacterium]|nr:hypothetical protein [Xanthobacteraceae bacterium]
MNPLQTSGPPAAPLPNAPLAPSPGASPQATSAPAPGATAPAAMPPPPTHAQTVATLRHLHMVNAAFAPILQDRDLGKTDQKSSIIDAVVHLVAERVVPQASAVMLLSQVPTDPLEQRKWLQNFYDGNERAAVTVLEHHAAGGPQTLDWQADQASFTPYDRNAHMKTMDGVVANYRGRRG